MRPVQLMRLLIIGSIILSLWTQQSFAGGGRKRKKSAEEPPARPTWNYKAEGIDKSKELAEAMALVKARNALTDYLANQTPRLEQVPPTEYIQSYLVKHREEHILSASEDEENAGKHAVVLEIEVTDQQYRGLLSAEREARVRERMLDLLKGMGVLVAFLTALCGYLRLEEATKGYYTTWLRLGAIGFVGAVGIGIWMVR